MHGACARTTRNTCWKCERMVVGQKGLLPGSWNTMVTMSLPMWRFRRSWALEGGCEQGLLSPQVPPHSRRIVPAHQWLLPHLPLGCLKRDNFKESWREGGQTKPRPRLKYCHPHCTPPWLLRSPWLTPAHILAPSHLLLVVGGVR